MANKYDTMKKKVIRMMKRLNQYDTIDNTLIDKLIESIEISDMAMAKIREFGVSYTVSEDSDFQQANPSIKTYESATKKILELSTKLGLSARDRVDIGIIQEDDDDF